MNTCIFSKGFIGSVEVSTEVDYLFDTWKLNRKICTFGTGGLAPHKYQLNLIFMTMWSPTHLDDSNKFIAKIYYRV